MASKKKKRRQKAQTPPSPPRFQEGAAVRVIRGTPDAEYPDIPLGGWRGRVLEVDAEDRPPSYLVDWGPETLQAMPAIFKFRCDRDDDSWEVRWLPEPILEADPGEPVEIEQPTKIVPRAHDRRNPFERVQLLLGLTSDDGLPPVSPETLARFHEHIRRSLRLPTTAIYTGEAVNEEPVPLEEPELVKVLRLLPPEEADPDSGLRVEVEGDWGKDIIPLIELIFPDQIRLQAVSDYRFWMIWNLEKPEEDSEDEPEDEPEPKLPPQGALLQGLFFVVFLGLILGGAPGALLAAREDTREWTRIGATTAALLGALLVGFLVMRVGWGQLFPRLMRGVIAGALAGGWLGGAVGLLLCAPVGLVLGAIAGSVVGNLTRWRIAGFFPLFPAGAALGALLVALDQDWQSALLGLGVGTAVACVAVVLFVGVATIRLENFVQGPEGP